LAPEGIVKRIEDVEIRTGFNKAKIIACYSRGPYRDAYLDVSVINITAKSYLSKSARGP
jgi:hypothetical protein